MREAEIDEAVLALEILLGEFFPVVVCEVERPADERAADAFVCFGDAGARHAGFFVAEVDGQAGAGEDEEEAGLPGEGSKFVFGFGFLDGFVRGFACRGEGPPCRGELGCD